MSQGKFSHEGHFKFLNHTQSTLLPATSSGHEHGSCLSFNPHLRKQSHSLKTQSVGSLRTRPIKASAAQSLYATAAESFYDLLGIPESVTPREIKQAYKKLVLKCHPDLSPTTESKEENTKKFLRVQEAYETLSDPKRRALYDSDLHYSLCLDDDDKGEWRIQWLSQLKELKKRSLDKENLRENMSWGARIRTQNDS